MYISLFLAKEIPSVLNPVWRYYVITKFKQSVMENICLTLLIWSLFEDDINTLYNLEHLFSQCTNKN
jgi:hypothetical protein